MGAEQLHPGELKRRAVPPLINPCVDARFALVVPTGRAPTWNQMGDGNRATASPAATSILQVHDEARGLTGVR
jgi:hypothetical protein